MTTDITTALETLQKIVDDSFNSKGAAGRAALSTIEAELTNAEARCATLTASLAQSVENMNREMAARDRAEAERDEAVAALREAMKYVVLMPRADYDRLARLSTIEEV